MRSVFKWVLVPGFRLRGARRLTSLAGLLIGLACVQPAWADNRSVIMVLGDSLSAAYGMEQSESWPQLLDVRLTELGLGYRVFNSSITGDTTEGGLARFNRLLQKHKPAVLIVELGGNDGLRGLPLDVTRGNLAEIIRLAQETGARVVLAGVHLPPNYGAAYTSRFSEMYIELAEQHGVALVPFILEGVALNEELMQPDGIHPTAGAQPRVLQNIWEALEPMLQQGAEIQSAE